MFNCLILLSQFYKLNTEVFSLFFKRKFKDKADK